MGIIYTFTSGKAMVQKIEMKIDDFIINMIAINRK